MPITKTAEALLGLEAPEFTDAQPAEDTSAATPKEVQTGQLNEVDATRILLNMGVLSDQYDMAQIIDGYVVELEHGSKGKYNLTNDDPVRTMMIVLAHLDEIPDYYTRLSAMEAGAKTGDAEDANH